MFNIPNAADAEDVTQAQPDSRDFSAMIAAAFAGTGVVTGCAVTAQTTPNMTVAVAAGTVAINGTQYAVTGGNVTIAAADPTNPRFSLICVDNTGALSSVPGVAAASPVFPDPAGKVVLAAVRVPAAATAINAAKIVDKRLNAVLPAPAQVPTGVMWDYAGTAAPSGWLLCDGSAISRTTYATLFSIIGTSYGPGDGSTTFNIPDSSGRVSVGVGTHADVNTVGKNEGMATVANRRPKHNHTNGVTAGHNLSLPNHGHSVSDPGHGHGVNDPGHSHNFNASWHADGPNSGRLFPDTAGPAQGGLVIASGTGISVQAAGTGVGVGNPTSLPGINGGVTIAGTVGPAGTNTVDSAPYLVCTKIIKT